MEALAIEPFYSAHFGTTGREYVEAFADVGFTRTRTPGVGDPGALHAVDKQRGEMVESGHAVALGLCPKCEDIVSVANGHCLINHKVGGTLYVVPQDAERAWDQLATVVPTKWGTPTPLGARTTAATTPTTADITSAPPPADPAERTKRLRSALETRRDAFDAKRADHAFLGSDIPPDRLEHARAKFLFLEPNEQVLAFLDETLTGNGKGGLVLTDRALYARQPAVHPKRTTLEAVRAVQFAPGAGAGKLYIDGEMFLAVSIHQNRAAMQAVATSLREVLCGAPGATDAPAATTAPPAAWYADPLARHEYRYWDGAAWTAHVSDRGETSLDEPRGIAQPVTGGSGADP
jgi:hypothetical protein